MTGELRSLKSTGPTCCWCCHCWHAEGVAVTPRKPPPKSGHCRQELGDRTRIVFAPLLICHAFPEARAEFGDPLRSSCSRCALCESAIPFDAASKLLRSPCLEASG